MKGKKLYRFLLQKENKNLFCLLFSEKKGISHTLKTGTKNGIVVSFRPLYNVRVLKRSLEKALFYILSGWISV